MSDLWEWANAPRIFLHESPNSVTAAMIQSARQGAAASIVYYGGSSPGAQRLVRPLAVFRLSGSEIEYVDAYCELRGARRTFRVDHLRLIQVHSSAYDPRYFVRLIALQAAVSAAVIRWQDVSGMMFASMMAVVSTPAKDAALRAKANAGWKNLSAAWRGIEAGINKFCADVGLTCDQLLSLAGGRPAAVEWAGRALHPDARASGRVAEDVRDGLWQMWQVRSQG